MPTFESLEKAVGPLLPGLIAAAVFIVLVFAARLKFRRETLADRLKTPATLLWVYLFLFVLTVSSELYWRGFYRVIYLLSLMVLALAIILALSVAFFDLFMGRIRKVKVPVILKDILVIIVYVIVIIIVLGASGVDLTSIITTSAVLTAVIGFALQDLLSNIISGLAIQFEQPFKVGHWVRFNEQEGAVLEINWRSTKIKTLHRDIVIIPNNVVTRSPIINFSVPTQIHRRKLNIGLRYEAAPNRVKHSILRAIADVEGVLTDPRPYIVLKEYADFSINYKIYFFINDFARRELIEDQVFTRIWYQLKRDGLTIPFPIRDVNVRQVSPEFDEEIRRRHTEKVLSALRVVPFLEPLAKEELTNLADNIKSEFYSQGEKVITQGMPGSSFFIIADGEVEVRVREREGEPDKPVAVLGRNNFFGERSLMTGEERSATVVATRDSELYVIDKPAFKSVIEANEALIEGISKRLVERQAQLEQTRTEMREVKKEQIREDQQSLMTKIRRFFQL